MFFKTRNVELYYEKTGEGEPLILLHGNGESHEIFNEAIEVLKRKFTVYAIDTRGHGQSSPVLEIHYDDIAHDIYRFIKRFDIKKPVVYGFSDGGIVALLLCIKHPDLLERAIVSGVNINPQGIKTKWLILFKIIYFLTKSENYKMMITEPNISFSELEKITTPVDIICGSRDMIKNSHMKEISDHIPNSTYTELIDETHGSYIIHTDKIARVITKKVARDIIERVTNMEELFDILVVKLRNDPEEFFTDDKIQDYYKIVLSYYENGLWLSDYEADQKGFLPRSLKRGILSQDGFYNFIADVVSKEKELDRNKQV